LAERPELLVLTKMDVTGAAEVRTRIMGELDREVVAISAVTGQGIPQLIHRIIDLLGERTEPVPAAPPVSEPVATSAVTATGV